MSFYTEVKFLRGRYVESWKVKLIFAFAVVMCLLLVLPMQMVPIDVLEQYNSMSSKNNVTISKEQFIIDYNEYIVEQVKIQEEAKVSIESSNTYGIQGDLASAALSEYEYYKSNGLVGGGRYWYWYDYIPDMVKTGKSLEDYNPYNSPKSSGVYFQSQNSPHAWCAYFVSCVAQKAGLSTGRICTKENVGEICMAGTCTDIFNFMATQGNECYLLETGYTYTLGLLDSLKSQLSHPDNVKIVKDFIPIPGDLIYLEYTSQNSKEDARFDHIGIVVNVSGNKVTYVHGNSSNNGLTAGNMSIVKKTEIDITNKSICGFTRLK